LNQKPGAKASGFFVPGKHRRQPDVFCWKFGTGIAGLIDDVAASGNL